MTGQRIRFVITVDGRQAIVYMTEQEMRDYVAGKCSLVDGQVVYEKKGAP